MSIRKQCLKTKSYKKGEILKNVEHAISCGNAQVVKGY